MTPDPLAAEVQRRVREELAELYDQALTRVGDLERRGEVHLARAWRSVASDLFEAERNVRAC